MSRERVQKTWGIPVAYPELANLSKEEREAIRKKASGSDSVSPEPESKEDKAGKRWEERMKQEIEGERIIASTK